MEFCGGHTHALVSGGLPALLPRDTRMIHGPGCPVCVLPATHIQALIDLVESRSGITIASYGDLLRIPTLKGDSLLKAQGRGLSIRMLYSPLELLSWARANPEREFVFLAIGFETTAPATALLIRRLEAANVSNVSVLCLHVLTPPAIDAVMSTLEAGQRPHALIGPGHVSLVTGIAPYQLLAARHGVPIVISGFEPGDLLESIAVARRMVQQGSRGVHNQYTRALREDGNPTARRLLDEVFEVRPGFVWRGLGELANSAYRLRPAFDRWNAEARFPLVYRDVPEHPGCLCGDILRGRCAPQDCKLFKKACTPTSPLGACMVSSEGACHAYYQTGAHP